MPGPAATGSFQPAASDDGGHRDDERDAHEDGEGDIRARELTRRARRLGVGAQGDRRRGQHHREADEEDEHRRLRPPGDPDGAEDDRGQKRVVAVPVVMRAKPLVRRRSGIVGLASAMSTPSVDA